MSKSRPKTRWSLIAILLVATALTYAGFRYFYPAQSADIFVVESTPLEYGDTTITGVLRKDTAVGDEGNFLLVLPDSRLIVLDVTGIDHLLGDTVSITGYLSPTVDRSLPMYMTVQSLSVLE